jgi:hypothetical protein
MISDLRSQISEGWLRLNLRSEIWDLESEICDQLGCCIDFARTTIPSLPTTNKLRA